MSSKPKLCCHPNCFECPYDDCLWNGYSKKDDIITNAIEEENRINNLSFEKRKEKEIQDKYNHSEKGKNTRKKYRTTESYRISQNKYRNSEKGKMAARERAKRFYYRMKLEREYSRKE